MSRVIRRVLDQIFEPAPEHGIRDMGILKERPDGVWPVDGIDDLDWLNSIDWTGGSFGDMDWLNITDSTQGQVGDFC